MKKTIWYVIEDLGDGSATTRFFNSEQEAKDYVETEENNEDYEVIFLSDGPVESAEIEI